MICSLRATHISGKLNQKANVLSRQYTPCGMWTFFLTKFLEKIVVTQLNERLSKNNLCEQFQSGVCS
ncbi:MAG: hypothetical protein ACRC9V_12130, partial [Aeromonas sp.]